MQVSISLTEAIPVDIITGFFVFAILSTSFNPDNSLNIRIFSEEKSVTGFKKVDPDLDDVYFLTLKDNL